MPTKIIDYWTGERDGANKALAYARTRLQDATTAVATAQTDRTTVSGQLTDLQRAAAAIRTELQNIQTPEDGEPLLEALRVNVINSRAKQKELLDAADALDKAQKALTRAQAWLQAAMARSAAAERGFASAKTAEDLHASWKDALKAGSPLSSVPNDAKQELAGQTYKDALGRLRDGDVPSHLFDVAIARGDWVDERVDLARTSAEEASKQLDAARHATGGAEGVRHAYEAAEEALRDYISNAQDLLARARSLVTPIKGSAQLSQAERDQINDPKQKGDREKAADAGTDVVKKEKAVYTAQAALDTAKLAAQAKDPDPAKVDADPDVVKKKHELETAQDDLKTSQADYDKQRAVLERWEIAVPDATWKLVGDLRIAGRLLDRLQGKDPGGLIKDLDKAEGDYGDALANAALAARKEAVLADVTRERQDHLTTIIITQQARAASAVRGDG